MAAVPQLYFFYGENTFEMYEHLALWTERFSKKYSGINITTVDPFYDTDVKKTIDTVTTAIRGGTLFGSTKLVILKNTLSGMGSADTLANAVLPLLGALAPDVFVIMYQNEPIKHKELLVRIQELVKHGKAKEKEFVPPHAGALVEWVITYGKRMGVTINRDTAAVFLEKFPNASPWTKSVKPNLWRIATELQKLTAFAYPHEHIEQKHIDALVQSSSEFQIWEIVNALLSKNTRRAAALLEQRLREIPKKSHEGELRMLFTILAGQIKKLLLVKTAQGYPSVEHIAKSAGWSRQHMVMLQKRAHTITTDDLLTWQKKLILLYKTSVSEPKTLKARTLLCFIAS